MTKKPSLGTNLDGEGKTEMYECQLVCLVMWTLVNRNFNLPKSICWWEMVVRYPIHVAVILIFRGTMDNLICVACSFYGFCHMRPSEEERRVHLNPNFVALPVSFCSNLSFVSCFEKLSNAQHCSPIQQSSRSCSL